MGSEISLEDHRQPAGWAKDFRRHIVIGLSRGGLLCNRIQHSLAKALLQSHELAANGCTEETVIAHLHKSTRKHMLEETLEKLLDGQRTLFELTGIGSPKLKGDLGAFQTAAIFKRQQTTIADGHPLDIRRQILERSLTICDRFAVHDPGLCPNLGSDLVEEFQFLQTAPEGCSK